MKRYFTLFVLLLTGIIAWAQDLKITKIELNPKMQTALVNQELDPVGQRKCAVLHVITEGLTPEERDALMFQLDNAHSIVKTVTDAGEIQLYVPDGTVKLTVKSRFGNYRGEFSKFGFKDGAESLKDYNVYIVYKRPRGTDEMLVTQQWLVFNISPKDALLWVNDEPWPVSDGVAQKYVNFGTYSYRVEASDYHGASGKVDVDDAENTIKVDVNLTPAFGYLKIEGDEAVLGGASVYVDSGNGADALRKARRLSSGQHTVRIIHPKYKPFERIVTIEDGKTFTLTANLNVNFSTVTLKVDADAEIWVNNERKGVRTWTGDLEAGDYTMECRMKGHRSSFAKHTITDNMSGQTITLSVPTPITGRLMVSSTPSLAKLFVDGKQVGETPKTINQIAVGEHTVRIEKNGYLPVNKTVTVEDGKLVTVDEVLQADPALAVQPDEEEPEKSSAPAEKPRPSETPKVTFIMANAAYNTVPQTSFGLTVGQVKRFGWYVSLMSNFNFSKADFTCDADGIISGNIPLEYAYTGKATSKWSATVGGLCQIFTPVCIYAGAGYGQRSLFWKTADGQNVASEGNSMKGLVFEAGLMAHFKGFCISAGATAIGTQYVECKVGVGYCF